MYRSRNRKTDKLENKFAIECSRNTFDLAVSKTMNSPELCVVLAPGLSLAIAPAYGARTR
jgi:hypothetical protein